MALSDAAVRHAKPRPKGYKITDSDGLYLFVTPAGGKFWRLKFRVEGREKKLAIGAYPAISLAKARKQRDEAREQLAGGKDPSREKQQAKLRARASAANNFGKVAKEFLDKRRREGLSLSTAAKSEYYISRMGPVIARLPISEIEAADLLGALRRIEAKGNYETARRTLQLAGRVFRYAVATARLGSDPSRDLRGALTAPKPKHYGAIIEAARAGRVLLRAIDGYDGQALTGLAMRLSANVFVRPGELRHAEWKEIDLEKGLWTIPSQKMKMRRPHDVPLSRQSIELLRRARDISGPAGYVFPRYARALGP